MSNVKSCRFFGRSVWVAANDIWLIWWNEVSTHLNKSHGWSKPLSPHLSERSGRKSWLNITIVGREKKMKFHQFDFRPHSTVFHRIDWMCGNGEIHEITSLWRLMSAQFVGIWMVFTWSVRRNPMTAPTFTKRWCWCWLCVVPIYHVLHVYNFLTCFENIEHPILIDYTE